VGTLKGALPYVSAGLSYWALLRMVRSGQWDAHAVLSGMSKKVLRALPAPVDGRLYLIGATTHKTRRGRQHPLGHVTRQSESAPYTFGFDMVVLIASWEGFRIPVTIAPIDPKRKGHQNLLGRMQVTNDTERVTRQDVQAAVPQDAAVDDADFLVHAGTHMELYSSALQAVLDRPEMFP
jgi:hypothetical protein